MDNKIKEIEKWAMNIENKRTLKYVDYLLSEVKRLRELEDAVKNALRENPEEKHCSCVPLLKAEIKRLREGLELLVDFIPDGWEVPVGWTTLVSQVRKLLDEK